MKFKVAEHVFEIEIPEGFDAEKYLTPYKPFIYDGSQPSLFSLRVKLAENLRALNPGHITECLNDEPPYFWIFTEEGQHSQNIQQSQQGQPQHQPELQPKYNFGFSYSKNHPDCLLKPGNDFKDNTVYIPATHADQLLDFAVSNAMMLLYTYNTTPYDTLLIHSSVTVKDSVAYSFLGRSGTGKSTHSRLWLENIPGTHLLNDDNPVIRIIDGKAKIYGTPWSGKTTCYRNEEYPLGGIVRLTQAPYNKITRLTMLESYAAFMPACSCMKWSRKQTDALHKTVEAVVRQVACWGLECLPDAEAAQVCSEAIAKN